jgi:hypothetical protein
MLINDSFMSSKYNYIENISEFTFNEDNCDGNDVLCQINFNSMSPLHAACRMNNEKILSLLLQHMKQFPGTLDLVINSLDGEGQPPIYYASLRDVKLINMLVEAGAEYDLHLLVNTALSNEVINRLEDFNLFNNLTKPDQKEFVQQQLYLLASMRLRDEYQDYLIENINKILDFFLLNSANFNKKNEIGELPIDIALRQYKLNIATQENFKIKQKNNYTINHKQLYTFFAFSRKTDVINYGLLYLSLKQFIQIDILKIIMEFYYFLTFDIEKEIYRSYAQKYTPQDIDDKFKSNKSYNFAETLHIEINNKINEKYKEVGYKPTKY